MITVTGNYTDPEHTPNTAAVVIMLGSQCLEIVGLTLFR